MRQRRKATTQRGKNLTDETISQIVRILDAWTDNLTWESLIDDIAIRLRSRYTRQALYKHERIKLAFALKKESLHSSGAIIRVTRARRNPEAHIEKIEAENMRLLAENRRLEVENERLLEQFVIWAYNAHTRGMDKDSLSQPLPRVNRGQTDHLKKMAITPTRARR
jgi:hypothetical protein